MEDWVKPLLDYAATALRPAEGKVELSGLQGDVEILTDSWGVPHVYAGSRADLYYAQGYLHAAERFWQIDLTRRVAQGRLAELLGEIVLPLDRFFRTLGLWRTAKSWLPRADEDTRRIGLSYFEGFKAGAASLPKPVEYQILASEPEIVQSFDEALVQTFSVALLMAFTLSPNWDFELVRYWIAKAVGPERARQLTPLFGADQPPVVPASDSFPGLVSELLRLSAQAGHVPGVGSNNWVVSGTKTTTGKPLLANDPHLKIQMPGVWMEMHLCSPDMEVAGVSLPGAPGVIIGHNRRVAWGFTNTASDVSDLYLEKLSEDGKQYEYQGEWHPVEVVREEINVRNETEPRIHEVRVTRHGPLLESTVEGNLSPTVIEGSITDALALKWIHYDVVATQRGIEGMNLASNWEEFRKAAAAWPAPGQNMVYADVDGNIGYQFTGHVPIRAAGSTGVVPQPGWTGESEWSGTIPFDDLPRTFNPECGYVATANYRMTDLDYPYHLTHDWELPYRVRRIVELLNEKQKLSHQDFARIQSDTYSGIAAGILPTILGISATGPRESKALEIVKAWDRRMEAASAGAAIFTMWTTKIAEAVFKPKLGEELYRAYFGTRSWVTLWGYEALRDILRHPEAFWVGGDGADNLAARDRLTAAALAAACDDLQARFGEDAGSWRWGKLHTITFKHPLTTAMPPLGDLLSAGPFEAPGADDTVNRGVFNPGEDFLDGAVASYRQIIDLGDFDRSLSIINTGNSGNPASPNYRDQSELWVKGEYHPAPFSREAVEKASAGRLLLTPS
jgi:penicillin G amidase